jgi:2-polyprenyl-3-methyl-5-hydroxy-6-metoxy-1,4-benzoquinol methylase
MYKELTICIICGSDLTEVLSLGEQYVVDFVKEKDESLLKAPLTLMKCNKCSFIQLKHRVNPDRLYKKFWYRSGINETMKTELTKIVLNAQEVVDLVEGDKVLDIGCNDGELLGNYNKGVTTFGVDPCASLVEEGMTNGKIDIGIPDYFSESAILQVAKAVGMKSMKFKIITAIAMFYDIEDPVQFLKDCKLVLHDEGVLVIQMNYLLKMLSDTAFDNISHEHLGYYSVTTLDEAVKRAGLELQGIEESPCNGGSIRAYITHKDFNQFSIRHSQNKLWLYTKMTKMLIEESKLNDKAYTKFSTSIGAISDKVRKVFMDNKDKKIYAYGASTRGTVLTQHLFSDDNHKVIGVAERDTNKIGLKMVGSWWPIVSESEFRENAEVALVLPWHFRESIVRREQEWIKKGGKFIFPLPDPVIIECNREAEMALSMKTL